mgnify:CR=1 FL=1
MAEHRLRIVGHLSAPRLVGRIGRTGGIAGLRRVETAQTTSLAGSQHDVAGVIGATLGMVHWQLAAFGIMCGFLAGGISSIWLLLTRRVKFGNTIPFGPYMLLGAWLAITLGSEAAISVLRLWYL